MLISEDKTNHLAHLVLAGIKQQPDRLIQSEDKILREIKRIITESVMAEEDLDHDVRKKISSLSRPIPEGSPEWEVLYQKYHLEETNKNRIGRLK